MVVSSSIRCRVIAMCMAFLFSDATIFAQAPPGGPLFEFHSGFWLNLHHYLYRQAQLTGSGNGTRSLTVTQADSDELQTLSPTERASWTTAVTYYKESVIQRDLLFDAQLIAVKDELEASEGSADLAEAKIPAPMKTELRRAAEIYRSHWWPRHDADNRAWIADLKPLVDHFGAPISAKMVTVYGQSWPGYPVRVDVVAYANWAGAYTTLHPTRPTISASDPANQGAAGLEIVFHETSHGMMDHVMDAISAAEADVNAGRAVGAFRAGSIWHAVLFYTAGRLVSDQIPGYTPYADKNGLWVRAWRAPSRRLIEQDWQPRLEGTVTLQKALQNLVADLAAERFR